MGSISVFVAADHNHSLVLGRRVAIHSRGSVCGAECIEKDDKTKKIINETVQFLSIFVLDTCQTSELSKMFLRKEQHTTPAGTDAQPFNRMHGTWLQIC